MADQQELEEYSQKWWVDQINKRENDLDQNWRNFADRIVKRYLDDREMKDSDPYDQTSIRNYNIFWANVQITKAALYATPPKPDVRRSNEDAADDVGRVAALILQRILTFDLQSDESQMHRSLQNAVEDLLVPGLGQVWFRLETETEPVPPPPQDPLNPQPVPTEPQMRIAEQNAPCDYVQWRDFGWEPARIWEEVGWVYRRCWMRKTKFIQRFGQPAYTTLRAKARAQKANNQYPKGFTDSKVEVFEIACKDTNKYYWVSLLADDILDQKPDLLQLDDFFPCPEPLMATHTTNALLPRPDYTMVADQYEELDLLNSRIYALTKALRVVGLYDKTQAEIGKMISGPELAMIGVDNWEAFAEKGGMKGMTDWFPVDVIAGVLEKLKEQRVAVINQIYELTSISDIMRGASNPRDTLGAQKLKAQYSSVRLQLKQQDIGLFVRKALRIKAEIIGRHFSPDEIKKQSQIQFSESAQFADQAIALIKQYETSEYRINVGEESLSLADYNAERELRVEYLTAVGQFLSQAGQMAAAYPAGLPYLLKMIAWVTAAFRGAADIETVLDQAIAGAQQMPPTPPGQDQQKPQAPPPPSPDEEAQAQMQIDNNQTKNNMREEVVKGIVKNVFAPIPSGQSQNGNV